MPATLEAPIRTVASLLDEVRDPRSPHLSPARFAKITGLSLQSLAMMLGVHRNTMGQHPESPKVQEALRAMLKAICAATEVTGDVDRAIFWFMNEPIVDYRHKTAVELVAAGRLDAVLIFLDGLLIGATG